MNRDARSEICGTGARDFCSAMQLSESPQKSPLDCLFSIICREHGIPDSKHEPG